MLYYKNAGHIHEVAVLCNTEVTIKYSVKMYIVGGQFLGTSPTDHPMQGDSFTQVTPNTGSSPPVCCVCVKVRLSFFHIYLVILKSV